MKARAPIPRTLPGEFAVLTWDPDGERFLCIVDDADRSSYDLGGDIQKVRRQMRAWGMEPAVADEAIDRAREFRACQFIPSQQRTVQLPPRPAPRTLKISPEDAPPREWLHALR